MKEKVKGRIEKKKECKVEKSISYKYKSTGEFISKEEKIITYTEKDIKTHDDHLIELEKEMKETEDYAIYENYVLRTQYNFNQVELIEYVKIFIEEFFEDSTPVLNEGTEADFAGTNQDSVMTIHAQQTFKKFKEIGILDNLK